MVLLLALMLTASAAGRPEGAQITPIGSVEEALRAGADAVVMYVALAIAKMLPKLYPKDWLPRSYARGETRTIHPDGPL